MLSKYQWKPFYDSYSTDIVEEFYIPVMCESSIIKRVSAYFSAKALSRYSQGLENLKSNSAKYYLIISEEIDEEDFLELKKGYSLRDEILNDLLIKFDDNVSLEEEKNISNLAYYIATGVIDVKIAFVKKGIFHDKYAIFEDEFHNRICMRGSNNETEAALRLNYESFELTCSWLASAFDNEKINIQNDKFDSLWKNETEDIDVVDIPEILKKKILTFNKGKVIIEKTFLNENSLIFDLKEDEAVIYKQNVDISSPKFLAFYKVYLQRFIASENKLMFFLKNASSPRGINKAYDAFKNNLESIGIDVQITKRLLRYIDDKNLNIDKRYRLGASIKNHDSEVFETFEAYKEIVNKEMARPLREKQMWDSFFMYAMKRSSNFSVPGSGKTASVYGVYSYLRANNIAKRLLVIGPKNSFMSWKDEFVKCFGDKQQLQVLDIQDLEDTSVDNKEREIEYCNNNTNLILVNYEIVPKLTKCLQKFVKENTLLVFDEVHKVKKASGGVRATACLEVARYSNYVITMTGTPIPNGYLDLYNNLNILYPFDYKDFFGFPINTLKNPSNFDVEQINNKIFPFFCRTNKKQLEVPDANEDKFYIQKATNNENALLEIVYDKYKKNALLLFLRLIQVESNPKMLLQSINFSEFDDMLVEDENTNDLEYVDYSNEAKDIIDSIDITSKKQEVIRLCKNLVDEKKRVIVWCIFNDSIYDIDSKLKSIGIKSTFINGTIDSQTREQILKCFKNDEFDVLVTNPHTLAESVSLHDVCHDAIYFEYSYNLVHLLQSKDRIHRLGLKQNQYTQYHYLELKFLYKGRDYNFDDRIYNVLLNKENNMLEAIDNNKLENVSTTQEDLDVILGDLKKI